MRNLAVLLISIALLSNPFRGAHGQTIVNTDEGAITVYSKSFALVIGNSAYQNFAWPRLPSIPNELDTLRVTFEEQGFEVRAKLNLRSAELSAAIKQFLQAKYPPLTRLIVFYAGHGWTDRAYTGYIVPTDAPDVSDVNLRANLISMAEIKTWADDSDVNHIMFLFDSCFSGSVFLSRKNLTPPTLFIKSALRKTRQFITAGNEEQTVPAVSEFVPAIIRGLSGEADTTQNGIITGNGLGYWLASTLTKNGKQTPQYGSVVPGNLSPGDMIFTYRNAIKLAAAPVHATQPPAGTPREAVMRSIGVPDSNDAEVFTGLDVVYYQKVGDGRLIIKALDKNKIPFRVTRAQLPETFQTNAIACGLDTPVNAIKALGHALIDAGVPLRTIVQFRNSETKKQKMEIVSVAADTEGKFELTSPPLTRQQVDNLTACPHWLHN